MTFRARPARRFVTLAMPLILVTHGRAAQQQRAQPRAERAADFLSVTFSAVGPDGTIVPSLSATDVAIRIDGRPREIRSLQLVSVGGAAAVEPLDPPFGTNAVTARGRSITLFLDDESFPSGGELTLRQAIDRLLSRLSPSDRVALRAIPHGGVNVAPTTDRARVRSAVSTIVGRGSAALTGSDMACRTRTTLEALQHELQALKAPDAPSIVALITAGLAAPRRDAPITMAPGMCELPLDTFRHVAEAAGRARAQFYVVPPVDIMSIGTLQRENIAGTGGSGSDNPVEGIEQLLGVTGGKLMNLGGGDRSAFDRIAAETSAYYVATIDPQRNDRGRSHALDVRVSRQGVEVRGGRTITFPDTSPDATRPSAASPREMLSTLAEFRDLPLRAAAFPSLDEPGGQLKVLAIAEPVDPAVKFSAVSAALFDRDGKALTGWVAQAEDLERAPVVGAMTAAPGAYRLRVAAIDATGRSGTADYEVDVAIARSGPLRISALLLGLLRGGFTPRLQFSAEPVVIGYVEMSGAPAGAAVTATLDLADTTNGPARVSVPLTIEAGAGRYVAKGAIPIGALPPADYVARAVIGLEGHPPTRVVRTLRKVKQ
jgi:hypothetical protein